MDGDKQAVAFFAGDVEEGWGLPEIVELDFLEHFPGFRVPESDRAAGGGGEDREARVPGQSGDRPVVGAELVLEFQVFSASDTQALVGSALGDPLAIRRGDEAIDLERGNFGHGLAGFRIPENQGFLLLVAVFEQGRGDQVVRSDPGAGFRAATVQFDEARHAILWKIQGDDWLSRGKGEDLVSDRKEILRGVEVVCL